MQVPSGRFWPHVPGYESDDDNGHEDSEAKIAVQARERLREIVKRLGNEWEELGVLQFKAPPTKLKKETVKNICPSLLTPSFRIEHTEAPVVRDTLFSNGMTQTTGRDWLIQWSGPGLRDSAYQELNEFQRVNHFPGSTELTRKDRLWMNFRDMAQTFGGDTFDFVPQTFVLPGQMQEFLDCYQKRGGLWIVKPNASSRGRGIFVLRDVADLPVDEPSVVSRYVENPLLIQGLKFDLRVYVLVTSYEPLRAYIYREGLVRFASKPYSKDPKHLTDAYRHLTNYSINKGSSTFVENSEVQADNVGHKWSISALNKHLRCIGVDIDLMWTRIMDAIVKSLLSVEPVIGARTKATATHSHNCFELYGFDVLVDQDLKPWLLEVNLSPSMQADSPLDWQIKSSLLADCFNLVGINRVSKQRLAEATRAKTKVVKVPGKPPGPPERRRRHHVSGRSLLRQTELEADDEEEEAEDLPAVPLGTLEVEELRSTANALLECTRNRNFIRLFPTRKAVRHYAVIVDSQEAMKPWPRGRKPLVEKLTASQVLASLLFGPAPSHGSVLTCRPRSRAIVCCSRSVRRREQPRYEPEGEDPGEETANAEAQKAGRSKSLPRARARKVSRRHIVVMKRSPAEALMSAAAEAAPEDADEADKAPTGAATPAKQEDLSAESEVKSMQALADKLEEQLKVSQARSRPASGRRSRSSSRPSSAAAARASTAASTVASKVEPETKEAKTRPDILVEKLPAMVQAKRPASGHRSRPSSRPGSAAVRAAAAVALAGTAALPTSPKYAQKAPLAESILYKIIDSGLADAPLQAPRRDTEILDSPGDSRIRWKWLQLSHTEIEL